MQVSICVQVRKWPFLTVKNVWLKISMHFHSRAQVFPPIGTVVVNKKLTYPNSNYGVITLRYGIPYIILHADVVHEIGCQL